MRIVVAGGTGFIGEPLCKALAERGEVVVLTRSPSRVRVGRGVEWHPPAPGPWREEVHTADLVINLTGESGAKGRWTEKKKRRLRESRISVTRSIVESLHDGASQHLINASAVGYYGDRGEKVLDESSGRGEGFLADLTVDWEQAAREAEQVASVTILRFGIVIGPGGGALSAMLPIFRLGLGGRLGHGRQWMPWIDRADLVRMVEWILDGSRTGVYNATSPSPVRNSEFTQCLGKVLHRPAILPAPAFALRIVLGEMADDMLLASARVVPKRAIDEGFEFGVTNVEEAFERSVSRPTSHG